MAPRDKGEGLLKAPVLSRGRPLVPRDTARDLRGDIHGSHLYSAGPSLCPSSVKIISAPCKSTPKTRDQQKKSALFILPGVRDSPVLREPQIDEIPHERTHAVPRDFTGRI